MDKKLKKTIIETNSNIFFNVLKFGTLFTNYNVIIKGYDSKKKKINNYNTLW